MADTAASSFSGIGTWVAMASGDKIPFIDVSGTGAAKNSAATVTEFVAEMKLNGLAGTAANTFTAAQVIDGSADAIQLRVQGNATQTADLMVLEDSAGTDVLKVSASGAITAPSVTGIAGITVLSASGNNAIFGTPNDIAGGYTQIRCSTGGLYFSHASYGNSMLLTADGLLISAGQILSLATKTPASASDTGITGTICWDSSYIYICTATNTWKRVAIATW